MDNWHSYFELLIQLVLGFGLLGFGIVSGWVFGREYVIWCSYGSFSTTYSSFHNCYVKIYHSYYMEFLTLVNNLFIWTPHWFSCKYCWLVYWNHLPLFYHLFRSFILTILLCTPVAFIASFTRGYLAPVGFVIATLFITNILPIGIPSIIPYVPWAIPALSTGLLGPNFPYPGIISYIILFSYVILGVIATLAWWRFPIKLKHK